MTYGQTIEYLFSMLPAYHRIGKAAYKNNLDNTKMLDSYFGHPHKKFLSVHIAGTNGKGSVSHMTASVLQEAGYKTGLYTSPHLKDFRERIKVNGEMIPKREVTAFVKRHQSIIDKVSPSFFEMSVALAFDYFARVNVDVAVIETGLGGRLDSTNVITPVLSIITNIGHDHMDLLGNTIQKVAAEKAGIIKGKIPVVIGETQDGLKDIFIACASERKSEIYFADQNFRCTFASWSDNAGERRFEMECLSSKKNITGLIPLAGDYQIRNLQTLFQTYDILRESFNLSELHLLRGIKNTVLNTGLQGRWQVLHDKPFTVCDTGHNLEGLEHVMRQVKGIPKKTLHIVLGFVSDKDISPVLPLFPGDAKYYFTRASVPRALDQNILAARAAEYGLKGDSYPDVRKAYLAARKNASDSDMIFIGGSTFVVAEVI